MPFSDLQLGLSFSTRQEILVNCSLTLQPFKNHSPAGPPSCLRHAFCSQPLKLLLSVLALAPGNAPALAWGTILPLASGLGPGCPAIALIPACCCASQLLKRGGEVGRPRQ